METRKEFIRKAALLSGGMGLWSSLPFSIQRALAINPALGSSFLDAEHIVILMQENRSFDHSYGTLQGVRGFADPRAIPLPDGKPVWFQTDENGNTYAPFHLDIKGTNATWMGSLPHSWANQVDARNQGRHDRWLHAKKSRRYPEIPLTLGYYNRNDLPFYYSLADAFTICDQHFCSSLTGTHANRLYLMTGTIREKQHPSSQALVLNGNADFNHEVSWTTFPERLEEHGVTWKIYQNELGVETGLTRDEYAWLANLHCNMMEVFKQYKVRYAPTAMSYIHKRLAELPGEILQLAEQDGPSARKELARKKKELEFRRKQASEYTPEQWEALPEWQKSIHRKAFCTNAADPNYRQLDKVRYEENGKQRTVEVPKGDIYHQFREDVRNGTLPTVSWLIGPQHFSDHPASPWYGAWYVSEALDILTQNPEVWKKTIFILTYDENDGYFDHVPPFVAPKPGDRSTGFASGGMDTSVDFVEYRMDKRNKPKSGARESPIGLGYRVPLVIASPWSRGGYVCSEVFDHTSVLQFLEKFLSHKTGKTIQEPNISAWRRAVCGDLRSVFQPYNGQKISIPFPSRDEFVREIHSAQFKDVPGNLVRVTDDDLRKGENHLRSLLPRQEKGIRKSCAIPYELYVSGRVAEKRLIVEMHAGKRFFGDRSGGSPFVAYAFYGPGKIENRHYAVATGEEIQDFWNLDRFEGGVFKVRVDGPNGFMREYSGSADDLAPEISYEYPAPDGMPDGRIRIHFAHVGKRTGIRIQSNAYEPFDINRTLEPGEQTSIDLDTGQSFGWYDFSIRITGNVNFEQRFAGRVETGKDSFTDPLIGQ